MPSFFQSPQQAPPVTRCWEPNQTAPPPKLSLNRKRKKTKQKVTGSGPEGLQREVPFAPGLGTDQEFGHLILILGPLELLGVGEGWVMVDRSQI